jgi:hypothetical protein
MSVYKLGSDCALICLEGSKIGNQVENKRSVWGTNADLAAIPTKALEGLLETVFPNPKTALSRAYVLLAGR